MSRAHPGRSSAYKNKKKIAAQRKQKLQTLREAQKIYRIKIGCPNKKCRDMDWKVLNKIRKELESNSKL